MSWWGWDGKCCDLLKRKTCEELAFGDYDNETMQADRGGPRGSHVCLSLRSREQIRREKVKMKAVCEDCKLTPGYWARPGWSAAVAERSVAAVVVVVAVAGWWPAVVAMWTRCWVAVLQVTLGRGAQWCLRWSAGTLRRHIKTSISTTQSDRTH